MHKTLTKQLLLSSNYWVLNKDMVKIFGLETAFLLSNFAEAEQIISDEEGWFYQTSSTVEKMTTLSRHKQDQCIKQLEEQEVLIRELRGLPAKRYFKINYECLTNKIVNFQQTRMRKINKQDCEKSATNKEHINKESINKENNNISLQIKNLRDRYSKPQLQTIDEYFDILRWTRKYGKIADNVILGIYKKWEENSPEKVIAGLKVYINNPNHHDKKENYCFAIIKNIKTEDIVSLEKKTKEKRVIKDDNPFLNRS